MTLLELTVVILVILSLVSILFVSARAWKRSSDRAENILNLRNIQQAVRGHENLHGLTPGVSPLPSEQIFLSETNSFGYINEPEPPGATGVTSYTYLNAVPHYGELYVTNLGAMNPEYVPGPSSYATW